MKRVLCSDGQDHKSFSEVNRLPFGLLLKSAVLIYRLWTVYPVADSEGGVEGEWPLLLPFHPLPIPISIFWIHHRVHLISFWMDAAV